MQDEPMTYGAKHPAADEHREAVLANEAALASQKPQKDEEPE